MALVLQPVREGLGLAELLKGLAIAFVLSRSLATVTSAGQNSVGFMRSSFSRAEAIQTAGFFCIFLAGRFWLAQVDKHVPEPYLDEVFHIPQAQTYCEGRFWVWDDKITTPPGLYLLSVAYHKLWMLSRCTAFSLRSNNLLATLVTAWVAPQCRHLIEVRAAERDGKQVPRNLSFYSLHTGLNVALFPVIFFFSALYYTDVFSTLVVLLAYRNHLLRLGPQPPGLVNDARTVALGVAALLMRQTNVFWVVVYMGGLEAVHALRSVKPVGPVRFARIHDPPLGRSGPEDWISCALSIAAAALVYPWTVLRHIWPQIAILGLFAGFVAWNGGVVLGDKSNHIATLHLAQMLYIWPLMAFFSGPLFLPSLLSALARPFRSLKFFLGISSQRSALVSIPYTLLTAVASLAVVRYNTIVHPFTLADNRHYMFYVFRYTILRSPAVRLALVPAYTLCRWLAWDTLSGRTAAAEGQPEVDTDKQQHQERTQQNQRRLIQASPSKTSKKSEAEERMLFLDDPVSAAASSTPPPTSTALLWLLATSLSLVTAPLVEPRYFILPWVFYRLLVPSRPSYPSSSSLSTSSQPSGPRRSDGPAGRLPERGRGWRAWRTGGVACKVDVRLVLETAWFVAVNVATMYIFLARPFVWHGEGGEPLDGGRLQRFMW